MNINNILSLISIGEQQITFFAVALAAFMIWRDKRRLKRKMRSLGSTKGSSNRPMAIVIGIGNDPLAQVKKFLKDRNMEHVEILDYIFSDYLQPRNYPDAMINISQIAAAHPAASSGACKAPLLSCTGLYAEDSKSQMGFAHINSCVGYLPFIPAASCGVFDK